MKRRLTGMLLTLAMLLSIYVVLLIVGCVMDSTPAILILAPILYPIAELFEFGNMDEAGEILGLKR